MRLTERELVVLRHLAEGLTQDETAEALNITRYTIKSQIETICTKLNALNTANAVHLAHLHGLLGDARCLVVSPH